MNKNELRSKWRSTLLLRKDPLLLLAIIIITVSLVLFILFPLVKVSIVAFQYDGHLSARNFAEAFDFWYYRQAFVNSVVTGLLTAVLGTLIGFIFAYASVRARIPFRKFFNIIATVPIVSPPFIGALAIIMLFGRNGFITSKILGMTDANVYGFWGLMFAQIITFFPVSYITLKGVLESISPTLEDAAMDLGGNRLTIFFKVTLPLAGPGMASSILVLFVESLADFGNPMILAGSEYPILSVQAYLEITGMYNLGKGSALAFVLLVPSMTAYLIQKYWVSKKQYVTVTGKPTSSTNNVVSPSARNILLAVCLLIAALVILIYGSIIFGAFARSWGNDSSLTLDHFKYIMDVGFESLKDTLIIAGLSTPISGILGMFIAYLTVRKRFIGKKFIGVTSMLSFAVPGTVIGIGYILAFNCKPLYLTGTLLILLLNFVFRYIPVGIQGGIAVLRQIDPSIEEAAQDLGADSGTTFRKITLPLMIPAFFSGLVYAFVRSMTAVSAAIFLVSANWNLMTVQIMSQVESGRIGEAAAFSVILVLMILIVMVFINFLLKMKYHTKSTLISY